MAAIMQAARGARALRNFRTGVGTAIVAGGVGAIVGGAIVAGSSGSASSADAFSGSSFYFPENLVLFGNYMEFRAYQTVGVGGAAFDAVGLGGVFSSIANAIGGGRTGNGATIRLPLAQNLSPDYKVSYTDKDLGSNLAGTALTAGDRAMYGNKTISGAGLAQGLGAGAAATGLGLMDSVKKAAGALGTDAIDAALKVGLGVALNPHKILLFTGVPFRQHRFTWSLTPRNYNESLTIKNIIEAFIYYMYPSYALGGFFFNYPHFFDINFYSDTHLYKFLPAVIESVDVDYHGQGYAAYKRDVQNQNVPAPAEVKLTISFKETQIITKEWLNNPSLVSPGSFRPS
jgi:hypothetical protein